MYRFAASHRRGYIDRKEDIDEAEMKRLVHENCIVLKVSYAGYSVILTGDSNKPCGNASSVTTGTRGRGPASRC